LGKEDNTPRSLGASYRIGQNEQTGTSARRKISGLNTVRMAAQQEKGVTPATPPTEDRYRNADAVSTLRKMLRDDPELGNLPAEQQLRLAARRVNRRIDFAEVPVKDSTAVKRNASQREDDNDDEDEKVSPAKGDKPVMKAKRQGTPVVSGSDGAVVRCLAREARMEAAVKARGMVQQARATAMAAPTIPRKTRTVLVLLAAQRMTTAVCRTKNMILMTAFVSKTVMPIRTTRMHKKQRSSSRRKPRRS
jgi:hypothetical protein